MDRTIKQTVVKKYCKRQVPWEKKLVWQFLAQEGKRRENRACVHRFFVTLYGLRLNVGLKFNSWLIMRVIVSLICTCSNKSLQNRCYFFAFFEGRQARSERGPETRAMREGAPHLLCAIARPKNAKKIAPILQAMIGNYKIPLVFCRAIEEYVSKVTSRLVGWLKSAGTSSITAATLRTAKETLYKTRSNSRHWLKRFPPKPGYDEAIVHSNFWVCGWNPVVLPFKWNLFNSSFTWYYLFSMSF